MGSGNRIPTLGKVKKIPPRGASRLGEEFYFDLPLGGNSIPTPQIRRECLIPDEHMESILSDYINFENSSFEDEFKYNKISNDPTVRATLVEVVNKIQIMTN